MKIKSKNCNLPMAPSIIHTNVIDKVFVYMYDSGLIDYVKNDRGLLPRAVIITVSGLGGVVAGNRGKYILARFKPFHT